MWKGVDSAQLSMLNALMALHKKKNIRLASLFAVADLGVEVDQDNIRK